MSDTTNDKSVSTLAIVDKRPHKPGGCVGIFFQLFDWNRRFAKKKLFSKKLLPPGRGKQASKKFGGDEKLPKLRLIADENSGGFPNVKKDGTRILDSEQKHGMRPPSLVAKLMGLESMPVERQDKIKKPPSSRIVGVDKEENFVSDPRGLANEERSLEKREIKPDLRPQKLQKTGSSERRPMTKFGAEALQFKNVLSRSRKHHTKLPSPVKSPKSLSARNASRLIGAATRILEPRLQSGNRAKCAITYAKSMHYVPVDKAMLSKCPNYYVNEAKSLQGQSSCTNCGHSLHNVDSRPNTEELPSVFGSSVSDCFGPSQYSERSKPKLPISSLDQEQERVLHKGYDQAMENTKYFAEPISDRVPIDQEGQIRWHSTSQQCKHQKSPFSVCSSHKTQRQNQASLGRDRVPPRSKLSNLQGNTVPMSTNVINETKDFVALNRTLSGRTRSRMPAKVDNFKFETYGKVGNRGDEFLSPVRKRRSMNVSRQSDHCDIDKQKNSNFNTIPGKEIARNARSKLAHLHESHMTGGSGKKDNDVISFTYSSPVKHKSGIPAGMQKRRDQNKSGYNRTLQKNSMSNEIDGNTCFQKPSPLCGDTLGALLEQKLKELSFQEENEFAFGGTPPKRTSAMILQELISAITAEKPYDQDAVAVRSNDRMSNAKANITFQAKPKTAGASLRYGHDNNNLSPASVLEASFLNDSCFSSSLDDSSGHKLCADSIDNSYDEPRKLEPDYDLLDSATSLSNRRTVQDSVTHLDNQISEALRVLDVADAKLNVIKLAHAKEVILNAELVYRNVSLCNPDRSQDFSLVRFLLDELETLGSVMWTNCSCFLGFEDTKEGNLLKGFLFDCVVEYLELSYGQYSWTRLPLRVNNKIVIQEVVGEVRRWAGLAGLVPDELIEREMSYGLGKWTDFEIEEFEIGVDIDGDIFEGLVDEIVIDLWEYSRVGFC
ncbi:hypothetical protein LguiA_005889 [Lonicera macranthoides]